ncbi:SprT family zinc-dependent metalloprotease [Sphingomicrobium sp. XHP0239]|uniref:M48 family metallopeptidase n=1 Tax=Sphingomicrobium maritimum TaxID=3133972 RepID=UPI0031CC5794
MRSDPLIQIVRHHRARRFLLRYDPVRDRVRLTIPRRASQREALTWAATKRDWIEGQRRRRAEAVPLTPGSAIPFRGEDLTICHDPAGSRRVERIDDRLRTGGPIETVSRRIEQWLRTEARRLLSDDVAEYAARAGVSVKGVSVGDARTRWGSCSGDGRLRFSWRLVCAPDAVRRYVVAHEIAHRLHMDHSPAFRRAEAELVEGYVTALEAQLRALGPGLQRIGR